MQKQKPGHVAAVGFSQVGEQAGEIQPAEKKSLITSWENPFAGDHRIITRKLASRAGFHLMR
jgi:hypothetical protein